MDTVSRVPPAGPWAALERRLEFSTYIPRRVEPADLRRAQSRRWGPLLILKSRTGQYVQLTERDEFLYQHMDGTKTVQDLVLLYFHKFESFALDRVSALVHNLRDAGLLEERPVKAFESLAKRLGGRSPEALFAKLARMFVEYRIEIRGLDRLLTMAYKVFFWPFFTRPAYAAYIVLAAVGTAAFASVATSGEFGLGELFTTEGSVAYGALALGAAMAALGAVHQLAHIFAAKALGREVPSAGIMISYGLPFVYAQTTDVWLEPQLPRLLSSLAGTISDLLVGASAGLALVAFPNADWRGLAFKLAAVSYAALFMDLNPLFELDGYYALEDWLEMPGLRSRAFAFLRRDLRRKLAARERFDRDEKILFWYGALAVAWLAVIVISALIFLAMQARKALGDILSGGSWLSSAVAVGIMVFFVIPLTIAFLAGVALAVLRVVRWVRMHPAFREPRRLAKLILAGTAASCAAIFILPTFARQLGQLPAARSVGEVLQTDAFFPVWGLVYPALVPGISAAALALSGFAAKVVKGSRLDSDLRLLGLFFASELGKAALESYALSWGLLSGAVIVAVRLMEVASLLAMLAWLLHLFWRVDWPVMGAPARLLWGAALAVALGGSVFAAAGWGTSGVELWPALAAGASCLVGLFPTLVNYSGTPLWWGWALLLAGGGARTLAGMARITGHELSLYLPAEQLGRLVLAGTQVELLGAVLMFAAALMFVAILKRTLAAPARPMRMACEESGPIGERARLAGALDFIFSTLVEGLARMCGRRCASAAVEAANGALRSAGLRLRLDKSGFAHQTSSGADIVELAEAGRLALAEMERHAIAAAGEEFFRKIMSSAYDSLFWNEREPIYERVLRGFRWASEVARMGRIEAADIDALIAGAVLFEGLSAEERKILASRMRPVRFRVGDVVVREGELAESFYMVVRGELEVYHEHAPREVLAVLSAGDYFGEGAALENARRSASVRARTDCELLKLASEDFRSFVRCHVDIAEKMSQVADLVELLRKMPAFGEMPLAQVAVLASAMNPVKVGPGDVVVRQGEPGTSLYVVRRGELEVLVEDESHKVRRVALLGPGEYFGEIALLERVPRTATVRALTECELFALSKEDFDRRVGRSLAALAAIGRVSSRRRREIRERQTETTQAFSAALSKGCP